MAIILVVLSVLTLAGLAIAASLPAAAQEQPASKPAWTPPVMPDADRQERRHSRPAADRRNQRTPSPHFQHSNVQGHRLDAQKAIRAFDFALKSFGQSPPWSTPDEMDGYIHDLNVMLDEGDLRTASLELLGHDQTVLYRYRIEFRQATGGPGVDAAQGIELPLIPPGRIARHRLLVGPVARLAAYQSRLRHRWGSAQRLSERAGSQFASEHTRRVNGDRMTGQVFVTDEARRTATIVTVSPAGDYAFARDRALPVDVYLHRALCDVSMAFTPGKPVSFVPIQTPRGLQGRSIRPA